MGLKVLLADDSAAISKVIQICLQDFGVEIKSVGSGKDAYDAAKSYKPDIAFIDVMLPHKPGFDVAAEIKNDPLLKKTPVVMLWSSFVEFDQLKFKKSGADDKLEKPFEAKDIRQIVKKLVSKAQTQPLSDHVQLPKIDFPSAAVPPAVPKAVAEVTKTSWNTSSFQDISEFAAKMEKEKPTPKIEEKKEAKPEADADSGWVRKDINKFKINLDSEGVEENTVSFQYDDSKIKDLSFLMKQPAPAPTTAEVKPEPKPEPKPEIVPEVKASPKPEASIKPVLAGGAVSDADIKKLIEAEVKKLVAELVPDLAEQLIKEEIQKLTQ